MAQILTARSNGRLFGYLCTVISHPLEDAGATVAHRDTDRALAACSAQGAPPTNSHPAGLLGMLRL